MKIIMMLLTVSGTMIFRALAIPTWEDWNMISEARIKQRPETKMKLRL